MFTLSTTVKDAPNLFYIEQMKKHRSQQMFNANLVAQQPSYLWDQQARRLSMQFRHDAHPSPQQYMMSSNHTALPWMQSLNTAIAAQGNLSAERKWLQKHCGKISKTVAFSFYKNINGNSNTQNFLVFMYSFYNVTKEAKKRKG